MLFVDKVGYASVKIDGTNVGKDADGRVYGRNQMAVPRVLAHTCERWAPARRHLQRNHKPEPLPRDVRTRCLSFKGGIDIYVAGPPCQQERTN